MSSGFRMTHSSLSPRCAVLTLHLALGTICLPWQLSPLSKVHVHQALWSWQGKGQGSWPLLPALNLGLPQHPSLPAPLRLTDAYTHQGSPSGSPAGSMQQCLSRRLYHVPKPADNTVSDPMATSFSLQKGVGRARTINHKRQQAEQLILIKKRFKKKPPPNHWL